MASVPAEKPQVKPSFAKVAASAYIPQNTKEIASNTKNSSKSPQPPVHLQNSKPTSLSDGGTHKSHNSGPEKDSQGRSCDPETRTGQWANATGHEVVAVQPSSKDVDPDKPPPSITLVKSITTDDNTTQLSSSDGSAKPPSLDGKSVASATTFALDEKESIRPDDSASLRAVEEEDVISPPDSVAAGSRVGSDSGVNRAFRDQLNEISVMGPLPQRGAPPGRFQAPHVSGNIGLFEPTPPSDVARPLSQPLVNGTPNPGQLYQSPAVPDDKLIEALESPRDRLFVLKLEQDFIDFIKDSNENELSLPNCNTFYRMLTHRLADYYFLGHVVDESLTAVKVSKTPFCRIPPPLSSIPIPSKAANTPPIDLPARKIMRRGDEGKSGTNTTANSEGPSKATSEAGGSGSDGGDVEKDKSAMTREEREARYKEARQRIFGAAEAEESETADAVGSGEEKDVSRSSSASGKKKGKKQRNYDDDGFEARSRFNIFYPTPYASPGYSGDGNTIYYGGFPGAMTNPQYPAMGPNASPPTSYNGGFPVMMQQDTQPQYGWTGQTFQNPNSAMNYQNYAAPVPNGYDFSADFQRGMQFQSPTMPSQATPKMSTTSMASYTETYRPQSMPINQAWPQMAHQPSYPMNQPPYVQSGQGDRPMSTSSQGLVPGPYAYGQFPQAGFNTGMSNKNQHPLPGSFNRQQFNPKSQSFVPGGRNAPFPMQTTIPQMPPQNINNYGNFQIPMANQMQRPSPPSTHPSVFGSPRVTQNTNSVTSKANTQNLSHPLPQPVSSQAISAQPSSAQPANSSVPAQSSIAKWGTPAHLPPKPPPPAQPAKFLPSHTFSPGPRLPGTMGPSFTPSMAPSVRGVGGGAVRPNSQPN